MTMRNKYVKRSRISEKKFRHLVKLFSLDLDAVQISELSHLNRNTINRYFKAPRIRIAWFCEVEYPFNGEVVPIKSGWSKESQG
jgi:transposase